MGLGEHLQETMVVTPKTVVNCTFSLKTTLGKGRTSVFTRQTLHPSHLIRRVSLFLHHSYRVWYRIHLPNAGSISPVQDMNCRAGWYLMPRDAAST